MSCQHPPPVADPNPTAAPEQKVDNMNAQFSIPGTLVDGETTVGNEISSPLNSDRLAILVTSSVTRGQDGQINGVEIRLDRGCALSQVPMCVKIPSGMSVTGATYVTVPVSSYNSTISHSISHSTSFPSALHKQ